MLLLDIGLVVATTEMIILAWLWTVNGDITNLYQGFSMEVAGLGMMEFRHGVKIVDGGLYFIFSFHFILLFFYFSFLFFYF